MQAAGGAQHFAGQFTPERMGVVCGLSGKLHDTFELLAQDKEEVPILPHERAVVTNTFS